MQMEVVAAVVGVVEATVAVADIMVAVAAAVPITLGV